MQGAYADGIAVAELPPLFGGEVDDDDHALVVRAGQDLPVRRERQRHDGRTVRVHPRRCVGADGHHHDRARGIPCGGPLSGRIDGDGAHRPAQPRECPRAPVDPGQHRPRRIAGHDDRGRRARVEGTHGSGQPRECAPVGGVGEHEVDRGAAGLCVHDHDAVLAHPQVLDGPSPGHLDRSHQHVALDRGRGHDAGRPEPPLPLGVEPLEHRQCTRRVAVDDVRGRRQHEAIPTLSPIALHHRAQAFFGGGGARGVEIGPDPSRGRLAAGPLTRAPDPAGTDRHRAHPQEGGGDPPKHARRLGRQLGEQPGKRSTAVQRLEQRHAERELVGSGVDWPGVVLLRGHVGRCPHQEAGAGQPVERVATSLVRTSAVGRDVAGLPDEAEIGDAHAAVAADEHVVGLEVAVLTATLRPRSRSSAE
jgi:hypothetical protein